ncbi:hypothetical protein CAC42_5072 [Sphaceloma murrayae]|uniref:BTB domain-containing protein n=1 Tax=Sphaceloma murrayae TaxID=2082308 RepID=A0A2K1QUI2_9PEZI|nr:hypothetical protein CAC42_5072 [Sphaceloma murrayae]
MEDLSFLDRKPSERPIDHLGALIVKYNDLPRQTIASIDVLKIHDACPLLAEAFEPSRTKSICYIDDATPLAVIAFLRWAYTGSLAPSNLQDAALPLTTLLHVYRLATNFLAEGLSRQAYVGILRALESACYSKNRPLELVEAIDLAYAHHFNDVRLLSSLLSYCASNLFQHDLVFDRAFIDLLNRRPVFHQDLCVANMAFGHQNEGAQTFIQVGISCRSSRPGPFREVLFDSSHPLHPTKTNTLLSTIPLPRLRLLRSFLDTSTAKALSLTESKSRSRTPFDDGAPVTELDGVTADEIEESKLLQATFDANAVAKDLRSFRSQDASNRWAPQAQSKLHAKPQATDTSQIGRSSFNYAEFRYGAEADDRSCSEEPVVHANKRPRWAYSFTEPARQVEGTASTLDTARNTASTPAGCTLAVRTDRSSMTEDSPRLNLPERPALGRDGASVAARRTPSPPPGSPPEWTYLNPNRTCHGGYVELCTGTGTDGKTHHHLNPSLSVAAWRDYTEPDMFGERQGISSKFAPGQKNPDSEHELGKRLLPQPPSSPPQSAGPSKGKGKFNGEGDAAGSVMPGNHSCHIKSNATPSAAEQVPVPRRRTGSLATADKTTTEIGVREDWHIVNLESKEASSTRANHGARVVDGEFSLDCGSEEEDGDFILL